MNNTIYYTLLHHDQLQHLSQLNINTQNVQHANHIIEPYSHQYSITSTIYKSPQVTNIIKLHIEAKTFPTSKDYLRGTNRS